MEFEKIVLVTRKTRLEGLVERFNTLGQARFYLEHSGEGGKQEFARFEREHSAYHIALNELRTGLQRLGKLQVIERGFLPSFMFGEHDLVVTVGIDGLVVNTAKYLHGQPLVAVNPDPAHIDGVLLPFNVSQGLQAVQHAFQGQLKVRQISMAEARLNNGQSLIAFNDFFVGVRSHVSARYQIQFDGRSEHHSSSGIIISTGAGASGWLSSLFNMANGMLAQFCPQDAAGTGRLARPELTWEAESLVFVVREPFISKTSGAQIVCGTITPEQPLVLRSEMSDGGVIFSDGIEADFLEFHAGTVAEIGLAHKKTQLVV